MNICISLNLAINSPIETGCHNDNLIMKRGTENCSSFAAEREICILFKHFLFNGKVFCVRQDGMK